MNNKKETIKVILAQLQTMKSVDNFAEWANQAKTNMCIAAKENPDDRLAEVFEEAEFENPKGEEARMIKYLRKVSRAVNEAEIIGGIGTSYRNLWITNSSALIEFINPFGSVYCLNPYITGLESRADSMGSETLKVDIKEMWIEQLTREDEELTSSNESVVRKSKRFDENDLIPFKSKLIKVEWSFDRSTVSTKVPEGTSVREAYKWFFTGNPEITLDGEEIGTRDKIQTACYKIRTPMIKFWAIDGIKPPILMTIARGNKVGTLTSPVAGMRWELPHIPVHTAGEKMRLVPTVKGGAESVNIQQRRSWLDDFILTISLVILGLFFLGMVGMATGQSIPQYVGNYTVCSGSVCNAILDLSFRTIVTDNSVSSFDVVYGNDTARVDVEFASHFHQARNGKPVLSQSGSVSIPWKCDCIPYVTTPNPLGCANMTTYISANKPGCLLPEITKTCVPYEFLGTNNFEFTAISDLGVYAAGYLNFTSKGVTQSTPFYWNGDWGYSVSIPGKNITIQFFDAKSKTVDEFVLVRRMGTQEMKVLPISRVNGRGQNDIRKFGSIQGPDDIRSMGRRGSMEVVITDCPANKLAIKWMENDDNKEFIEAQPLSSLGFTDLYGNVFDGLSSSASPMLSAQAGNAFWSSGRLFYQGKTLHPKDYMLFIDNGLPVAMRMEGLQVCTRRPPIVSYFTSPLRFTVVAGTIFANGTLTSSWGTLSAGDYIWAPVSCFPGTGKSFRMNPANIFNGQLMTWLGMDTYNGALCTGTITTTDTLATGDTSIPHLGRTYEFSMTLDDLSKEECSDAAFFESEGTKVQVKSSGSYLYAVTNPMSDLILQGQAMVTSFRVFGSMEYPRLNTQSVDPVIESITWDSVQRVISLDAKSRVGEGSAYVRSDSDGFSERSIYLTRVLQEYLFAFDESIDCDNCEIEVCLVSDDKQDCKKVTVSLSDWKFNAYQIGAVQVIDAITPDKWDFTKRGNEKWVYVLLTVVWIGSAFVMVNALGVIIQLISKFVATIPGMGSVSVIMNLIGGILCVPTKVLSMAITLARKSLSWAMSKLGQKGFSELISEKKRISTQGSSESMPKDILKEAKDQIKELRKRMNSNRRGLSADDEYG